MEFDLTETQKLFKSSARELFLQECPPALVREMIERGDPYSGTLWTKLVEQGWTGLMFHEEVGGLGLGMVEMAIAFEEMGRALVPGAFLSSVALAGSLIEKSGSEQREKLLRAISEGEATATVALLEESGQWEIDAVNLRATDKNDSVTLNGKKMFVADAGVADYIITAARSGSDIILVAVPGQTPGVITSLLPSMDSTRHLYAIEYNEVTLGTENVLARGKAARDALAYALDVATLAVSAEMVGGMQRVLEASVEYAKTRKQFGKPIGQFQAVQHHCANMLLMTESARSAVYYAAWLMGNDLEQAPLAVSMAKAYTSDSYREVGNLGIQVHGGIGFTWEDDIHFYYKRAKASELMFGDATYHRERIARIVIDHASEPARAVGHASD